MPIELTNAIIRLIAMALIGGIFLTGLKAIIRARRQGGSQDAVLRLADAVERLEDQVSRMRLEQGELAERVDFAERLLGRATEAVPREGDRQR
jgi:hypothetical protein